MGTGLFNPIAPDHEYTLSDYTITAKGPKGLFPFAVGASTVSTGQGSVEDFMYGDKAESKTTPGSGANPRAHTRTLNKPTMELTIPIDIVESFRKFVGRDGVVDVIFTRQAPGGKPVTDVVKVWKPVFAHDTSGKSGDASVPKIAGNALRIDRDTKGVVI